MGTAYIPEGGPATLTEYAYETIPGKAIVTGDNGENEAGAEKPSAVTPRVMAALGALALGADGLSLCINSSEHSLPRSGSPRAKLQRLL